MGEHDINGGADSEGLRAFVRALLEDVRALERMLEEGRIESGVRRIGAEQELVLVDSDLAPAPVAECVLEGLAHPQFTTELGRFNLEANLTPQVLGGDCLSRMETELIGLLDRAQVVADDQCGARVLTCGILPTLDLAHLCLENMTPSPRFHRLNQVMSELRRGGFHTLIKGTDELQVRHDSVMLEACNTSFQVHFQVGPEEFAPLYNVAQVVTAPVLAAAVNSPLLLGHRLWHETRVALFQQSLDERSETHQARGVRTRVSFGDSWVEDSVLEIIREDIARFRVLLSTELDEPPMDVLDRGEIPALSALRLHNGTVYRWNRPCLGMVGGTAHLRIENRVLPSGPTVVDEFANAAFFFGLMSALSDEYGDVSRVMDFDEVRGNFHAAARYGLQAQFQWIGGRSVTAGELILDHLLPLAREGLRVQKIRGPDISRYLGVLEERVRSGRTGAQWTLDSWTGMGAEASRDARCHALVDATLSNQATGRPVHTWELATLADSRDWRHSYRTVRQVMTTDLFTVGPEDLVDLAASLMDWQHLRHVPVENSEGQLVGVLSHRRLLRMIARGLGHDGEKVVAVREIMRTDPVCASPETSTLEAIETMRREKVGCLPVIEDGRLVGIVTEHDFIAAAAMLLESELRRS